MARGFVCEGTIGDCSPDEFWLCISPVPPALLDSPSSSSQALLQSAAAAGGKCALTEVPGGAAGVTGACPGVRLPMAAEPRRIEIGLRAVLGMLSAEAGLALAALAVLFFRESSCAL